MTVKFRFGWMKMAITEESLITGLEIS